MSDLTHPTRVIVADCAFEFGNGVHDEGTVADDRSIERIAADQEQLAILFHRDMDSVAACQAGKLSRLDRLLRH